MSGGEHRSHEHGIEIDRVEVDVRAELVMVETSRPGGPPLDTDAQLPFDVAAVAAYEVRLEVLRDAVTVLQDHDDRP